MRRLLLALSLLAPVCSRAVIALDTNPGAIRYGVMGEVAGATVSNTAGLSTNAPAHIYVCALFAQGITDLSTNPPTVSCAGDSCSSIGAFAVMSSGGNATQVAEGGGGGATACLRATATAAVTNVTFTAAFTGSSEWAPRSMLVFAVTGDGGVGAVAVPVWHEAQDTPNAISITATGASGSWIIAANTGRPAAQLPTTPTYLANSTAVTDVTNISGTGAYINWAVYRAGVSAGAYTLGTSAPNTSGLMVAFELLEAGGSAADPAADIAVTEMVTSSLTPAALAASGITAQVSSTSALTTRAQPAAGLNETTSATGALSTKSLAASAIAPTASASATLTTGTEAAALRADVSIQTTVTCALTGCAQLEAGATSSTSVTAAVSARAQPAATVTETTQTSAMLSVGPAPLSAAVQAATGTTGALTSLAQPAAAVQEQVASSAGLTVATRASGGVSFNTGVTAALTTPGSPGSLSAGVSVSVSSAGALTVNTRAAANAGVVAGVSATLTVGPRFTAAVGVSVVTTSDPTSPVYQLLLDTHLYHPSLSTRLNGGSQ